MQVVFAKVTAKPGATLRLRSAAKILVPSTRKESGCLSYELFQSVGNDRELWFHARWTNDSSLDAHGKSEHVALWLRAVEEFAVGPVEVTVAMAVTERAE
jgi:quinol monooxygenase YgiN